MLLKVKCQMENCKHRNKKGFCKSKGIVDIQMKKGYTVQPGHDIKSMRPECHSYTKDFDYTGD